MTSSPRYGIGGKDTRQVSEKDETETKSQESSVSSTSEQTDNVINVPETGESLSTGKKESPATSTAKSSPISDEDRSHPGSVKKSSPMISDENRSHPESVKKSSPVISDENRSHPGSVNKSSPMISDENRSHPGSANKSSPTRILEKQNPVKISSPMRRMVPVKNVTRVQQVEEKVVQERKSVRTGSPRRRKATILHFLPTIDLPNVARVQLLLSNISERPLQFKLKSEPGPDIAALPSAKGRIGGHGSAKCILTWRRESNVDNWTDALQPKMLLVLDFLGDKTRGEKRTSIRLIGKVAAGQACDPNNPPVEQLMLDAVATDYSRSKSRENISDGMYSPKGEREKQMVQARSGGVVESIADWVSRQSRDSLLALLLLVLFFYFLGTINCSKRHRHYQ